MHISNREHFKSRCHSKPNQLRANLVIQCLFNSNFFSSANQRPKRKKQTLMSQLQDATTDENRLESLRSTMIKKVLDLWWTTKKNSFLYFVNTIEGRVVVDRLVHLSKRDLFITVGSTIEWKIAGVCGLFLRHQVSLLKHYRQSFESVLLSNLHCITFLSKDVCCSF